MVKNWTIFGGHGKRPFILTLWMEEQAQKYFNQMRKIYFPAQRNYLDAHLTLFHNLLDKSQINADVKMSCKTQKIFLGA
jgi:hypothetical protein